MFKKNRFVFVIILICVFCIPGAFGYFYFSTKAAFCTSTVSWDGERKFWTDNSQYNICDIKFQLFEGSETKEINSKKSAYDIKINTTEESGELNIKVYNDEKVLFNERGSVSKTLSISKDDSKNVKILLTGKNAKGHVNIKLK